MKKNGCVIEFKCYLYEESGCANYVARVGTLRCKHSNMYNECSNKKAQREAMKPKTRWTKKEATKKGFYALRHKLGHIDVGRFDDEMCIWILTGRNNCIASEHMEEEGYERSVKPLEL